MLLMNWPVAGILVYAAWQKPRITALTVLAVAATLIAVGITAYVWAVGNAAAGYPIPKETAQVTFRLLLIGLSLFPVWFLYLFLTGKFKDG